MKSSSRPLLGLALGGGVARGWSHIGVIKALERAGFHPEVIAGTSIGSIVGGCYAAGKLDELTDWVEELTLRGIFKYLDFSLTGAGFLNGNKLHDLLSDRLDHIHIENLQKEFIAVATEFGTGQEIWLKKGPLVPAMRASYALPGVFKPVGINGRFLMDGALVNPIPVSVCRAMGARIVIAVNLCNDHLGGLQHEEIISSTEEDVDRSRDKDEQNRHLVIKLLQRRFSDKKGNGNCPGMGEVMFDAFSITQDRIARARLAGDPPDFTVTPILNGIGMFDFHKGKEAIVRGETAGERIVQELEHILETLSRPT